MSNLEDQSDESNNTGASAITSSELREVVRDVIREETRATLDEYTGSKPLMDRTDVAKTLGCSVRKVEDLITEGKITPIWISKGLRRFHPDAIDAYIRRCERTGKEGR